MSSCIFLQPAGDESISFGFGVIAITASVSGVILNLITIAIIARGTKIGKETKIQLINASVANILSSIFLTLAFLFFKSAGTTSDELCKFAFFSCYSTLFVGVACSAVISFEKFLVVYYPFRALNYNIRWKLFVVAMVWLLGSLMQTPTLLYTKAMNNTSCAVCPPPWVTSSNLGWRVYAVTRSSKYYIVFIVIIVCYTLIGVKIILRDRIGEQSTTTQAARRISQRNKVLRMLAIDGTATVLIWLPAIVMETLRLSEHSQTDGGTNDSLLNATLILALINTFDSPIIFFLSCAGFRKDTRSLFRSLCCRRDSQVLVQASSSSQGSYQTPQCGSRDRSHD